MAAQGAVLRVLADADTLLRVLLRSAELTDPRTAFFIRNNERDTGLSVNFDVRQKSVRRNRASTKPTGFGVCSCNR